MKKSSLIILFSVMLFSACTSSSSTTPTLTSETVTSPTHPTTASPTSVNNPTLEAGQWTFIFYHEGLRQVVLVNGGPEQGKPTDDPLELWGWNGTQWSLISADENGPTWRNWPAIAYDSSRDVLVIHGGLQDQSNFDETWEWDGQVWTQFKNTGPGAREGALMAFDMDRAKMVLFGGSTPELEIQGDTWEWDDQTWTQVSETGPAPRFPGGMVYDPVRQEILMYSGHFAASTGEFIRYDDLWKWDGSSWSEIIPDEPTPGHRTHGALVFDPIMENILLVGSGSDMFLGDVWAWDGTKWEEILTSNTPVRSGHNVAYDPLRDRFVLFGGVDRPGGTALDDTWEWDRVQWLCVNNCQ
jgi:hypothetical protein